ncbi:uncharacterized protein SAPINGB_P004064 [Magnusiomyces paraingens]|uniref:ferric-chelate reductase (NADPH) n=1 Tax=Magnusiomyces paraingens TaxID=2606893 RepID=A0A5E8C001_9ASCO|nr:uncharacterized protein SAPINGB_P004064 [Saprochaete ingens]VVT54415.1 unnamed protein product [Saprochaete ingens]
MSKIPFTKLLSLLFFLLYPSYAQKVGVCSDFGLACWSASSALNFGCPSPDSLPPNSQSLSSSSSTTLQVDPTSAHKCLCQSLPFLQTYAYCIRSRIQNLSQINTAYLFLYRQCFYNADTSYSLGQFEDLYYNASSYMASQEYNNYLSFLTSTQTPTSTTFLTQALINSETLLDIPVSINNTAFDKQYNAAAIAKTQYRLGSIYGSLLLAYWGAIIVIAAIHRFIQQVYPEILFANNKQVNIIRKYLILPATFKRNRSRPVKLLLSFYLCAPTRGQSLILLGYLALTAVFLTIHYDIYQGNPITPGTKYQLLKYLGSRSGIIAFTQLPLVIAFAARNSPLIWLTGWPYDTFQIYHRWTARVMMINVLLHSACFMTIAVSGCTWVYRWEEIINWRFGNLATYSGVIMALVAINKFREHFYETFLVIHKIFFLAFMAGIFRHCWDFGWMPWVYAALAIYFSERLARVFKTTVSGVICSAYAEVYDDKVFRLTVQYSGRWTVEPGQYCYIRFLRPSLFWQAHPLSVYAGPHDASSSSSSPTLQFCVQAQNGATKTIAEHLAQRPNKNGPLRVLIQGPYGVPQKVENYDTVIFVAGGLGITAVYSYAQHLKQRGSSKHQRVVVMWIVRSTSSLEWFGEELAELATNGRNWFDIQVYVTDSTSRSASQTNLAVEDQQLPSFPDLDPCETLTESRMQRDDSQATLSLEELDELELGGGEYHQQYRQTCIHSITTDSSTSSLAAALHLQIKSSQQCPDSYAVPLTPTLDMGEYQRFSMMQLQEENEEKEKEKEKDSQFFSVAVPKTPTTPYAMHRFAQSDESLSSELFNLGTLPKEAQCGYEKSSYNEFTNMSRGGANAVGWGAYGKTNVMIGTTTVTPGVRVIYGKPDVRREIARSLKENVGRRKCSKDDGDCLESGDFHGSLDKKSQEYKGIGNPLAVMSCGPPGLVDSIRASIVEHLLDSEGRVDYFEEAFSW